MRQQFVKDQTNSSEDNPSPPLFFPIDFFAEKIDYMENSTKLLGCDWKCKLEILSKP